MTPTLTPLDTENEVRFLLNAKQDGLHCPGFARFLQEPAVTPNGWWTAYVYFEIHFGRLKNSEYRNFFEHDLSATYVGLGRPNWLLGFEKTPGTWVGFDWKDRQQPASVEHIKAILTTTVSEVDVMLAAFTQSGLILTDDAAK